MEQKLADFRARKRAKVDLKCGTVTQGHQMSTSSCHSNTSVTEDDSPRVVEKTESCQETGKANSTPASTADWLMDSTLGRWLGLQRLVVTNLTLLKVLLWLVLLGLFSELDFGLPFFLISLFYWLYEGLRSPSARQPGELSAYSVFNPDCQPLLGTLTAAQLEGEMGYRPLANR